MGAVGVYVFIITFIASRGSAFELIRQPADLNVAIGQSVTLRCVADKHVKLCQWRWRKLEPENETDTIVKEFIVSLSRPNDCSIRIGSARPNQEGLWTCVAHGVIIGNSTQEDITESRTAKLRVHKRPSDVFENTAAVVASVSAGAAPLSVMRPLGSHKLTLACRLPESATHCRWVGPQGMSLTATANYTNRDVDVHLDSSAGLCWINIESTRSSGKWRCLFSLNGVEIEGPMIQMLDIVPVVGLSRNSAWTLAAVLAAIGVLVGAVAAVSAVNLCHTAEYTPKYLTWRRKEAKKGQEDRKNSEAEAKTPTNIHFQFPDVTVTSNSKSHIYETLNRPPKTEQPQEEIELGQKLQESGYVAPKPRPRSTVSLYENVPDSQE